MKTTISFLTQDETKRLFAAIKSKRDRAIFLTAYRHGLRASEIGLLQIADLDLKRGRISIHRLKGSLAGVYPLQPDLIKLLRSHLRARQDDSPYLFLSPHRSPISRYQLDHLMKHYGQAAGLPPEKQKFHALKHSIATHLLDAGADLSFVKDWLGHANIQNTTILRTPHQLDPRPDGTAHFCESSGCVASLLYLCNFCKRSSISSP